MYTHAHAFRGGALHSFVCGRSGQVRAAERKKKVVSCIVLYRHIPHSTCKLTLRSTSAHHVLIIQPAADLRHQHGYC